MMKAGSWIIAATLVLVTLHSCDDDPTVGGLCYYHEISGTATIISVEEVGGTSICGEPVEVRYNFVPDYPDKINPRYLDNWPLENIRYMINGMNPPRQWIETFGLDENTDHPCTRYSMYFGACTPVYYEFDGIDDYSVYDSCNVWTQTAP